MITFIKNFKTKHPEAYDIIERAFWTFWEGFLLSLPVIIGLDAKAIWSAVIGAGATAFSAVKTLLLALIRKHLDKKQMEDEGDA